MNSSPIYYIRRKRHVEPLNITKSALCRLRECPNLSILFQHGCFYFYLLQKNIQERNILFLLSQESQLSWPEAASFSASWHLQSPSPCSNSSIPFTTSQPFGARLGAASKRGSSFKNRISCFHTTNLSTNPNHPSPSYLSLLSPKTNSSTFQNVVLGRLLFVLLGVSGAGRLGVGIPAIRKLLELPTWSK